MSTKRPIPTCHSVLVAEQPHVLSLSNKTPKGRRRARALLELPTTEDVSPGDVVDARNVAISRTLAGARRDHATA